MQRADTRAPLSFPLGDPLGIAAARAFSKSSLMNNANNAKFTSGNNDDDSNCTRETLPPTVSDRSSLACGLEDAAVSPESEEKEREKKTAWHRSRCLNVTCKYGSIVASSSFGRLPDVFSRQGDTSNISYSEQLAIYR